MKNLVLSLPVFINSIAGFAQERDWKIKSALSFAPGILTEKLTPYNFKDILVSFKIKLNGVVKHFTS